MKIVNVLFLFNPFPALKKRLRERLGKFKNLRLIFPNKTDEKSLIKHAPGVNAIVGWMPPEELLQKAENLKLYINPGAGVKHLMKMFAGLPKSRKVVLVNGHGNAYFTAQHTVALLLTLANKILPHHRWLSEGKWRRGDNYAKSVPLRKKTVGFLGYGHINRQAHKFLSGFDLDFVALKRSWKTGEGKGLSKKFTSSQLDDFLRRTDILITAIPQTDKTKHLIKLKHLRLLGKEGLLVNVGRGDVIKEESLYKALKENIIAGAAIDVWYDYDPKPDRKGRKYPYHFPFHKLANTVISPHRAASPFDDLDRWDDVIENLSRLAQGKRKFLNEVDLREGY